MKVKTWNFKQFSLRGATQVNSIKENSKQEGEPEENALTKGTIKEIERKKLQDFYSSVLGSTPEEVKNNSRVLRRKIYIFGLVMVILALFLYFFVVGKVSFVTA